MGLTAETKDQTTRSWLLSATIVFACALVARLIHLLHLHGSPFTQVLVGDGRQYDAWAQRIAADDWLGTEVFYRAPLYPHFLATVYAIIGHDLLLARVVQVLIASFACVLLYLAGRAFFGSVAGLIAGLLWAFYPPAIFFDALIQKTVLDVRS